MNRDFSIIFYQIFFHFIYVGFFFSLSHTSNYSSLVTWGAIYSAYVLIVTTLDVQVGRPPTLLKIKDAV